MLRYGLFYGHGASNGTLSAVRAGTFPVIGGGTGIWSFCEITGAAAAMAAAVTRGAPGLYNIVDDEPAPAAEWVPFLARCLGAEARRRYPPRSAVTSARCRNWPGWLCQPDGIWPIFLRQTRPGSVHGRDDVSP